MAPLFLTKNLDRGSSLNPSGNAADEILLNELNFKTADARRAKVSKPEHTCVCDGLRIRAATQQMLF